MTLRDLAREAGIDRSTLAAIEEGGDVQPRSVAAVVAALERIEKAVGVPDGDLPPARARLEAVIFGVLADKTSDIDWLDEVGARLTKAIIDAGLLRDS